MKDNGKSLCSFWGLLDFLDQWTIWRGCYHVSHCSFVRLSSCVVTPLSVSVCVCVLYLTKSCEFFNRMKDTVNVSFSLYKFLDFTFKLFYCIFVSIGILPACVSADHVCAWCPQEAEKGVRSSETEIIDHCKLKCVFWKSIPCLLWEQPLLLITVPLLSPTFLP